LRDGLIFLSYIGLFGFFFISIKTIFTMSFEPLFQDAQSLGIFDAMSPDCIGCALAVEIPFRINWTI